MRKIDENRLLSRITFITSLGDFLSYFATLIMVYEISKSIAVSAYTVAVKTVAVAAAGILFPLISTHFSFRALILLTQVVSGVLIGGLALYWQFSPTHSAAAVFGILFGQSFLKQIFEGAREARSRILGDATEQRSLQAQILNGLYAAQFIGPILSFFLIKYVALVVPLCLDSVTFFVTAILALQVGVEYEVKKYSFLKPFSYLSKNRELFKIFWIRSVGMWIPIGVFNYMVFPMVQTHYGLELINSAWVYVAVGLGSMLATLILMKRKSWISDIGDWKLASMGFVLIAVSRLFFMKLSVFPLALCALVLGGFFNGLNATVTQAIRRNATTPAQLPEVIGAELFIGKVTDWVVATISFFLISRNIVSPELGVLISALAFVAMVPIMMSGQDVARQRS